MKTKSLTMISLPLLSAFVCLCAACRRSQTNNEYLQQQLPSAQQGNYWAAYKVWDAYHRGKHGVAADDSEARKWLGQLVKGVSLVKFEPVNGFNPATPKEFLDEFHSCSSLMSSRTSIGGASFFRTQRQGDKLVGSFLTEQPDRMKAEIERSAHLKFISAAPVTPEIFQAYEASSQESL